jgi:hypothetical protein
MQGYQVLLEAAEQLNTKIFPLGCYPGDFTPKMRDDPFYKNKEKIFGKKKFQIAGKNIGFHFHHTMPKGVFDREKLKLRKLIDSQAKTSLMSAYNLLIALDPMLTTITQSSPFYQGIHYGKDSRLFWYRGGRKLKFMDGLYSQHPLVGALPPYKQTLSDLNYSISRRYTFWKKQLKKAGLDPSLVGLYKSVLDISWNPVKVNKHDTLEQRGMDMNYADTVMGVTTILNYVLDKVQDQKLLVLPSDIGRDEPFKIENKILHIPPHTFVRNKLQYESAKNGFDSKEIVTYGKRFAKLAKWAVPKGFHKVAQPVYDIITQQKTVSDRLLKKAKKKGWKPGKKLSQKQAAELALGNVKTAEKKLKKTERLLQKFL